MVAIRRCVLVLALTVFIGSDAFRVKKSVHAVPKASGNRGTGLSAGNWKVDGGLYWNGINVDSGFRLDYEVASVSDSSLVVNALSSSIILGANLPAGGYTDLRMNYQTVNTGWWDNRTGYYLEQQLCTVAERCLSKIFLQEGDSKIMIYASVYGISQWVTSGSSSSDRAADALVELRGDRGTGLSGGNWKVDGGLYWYGVNVDSGFWLEYDVVSVNNKNLVVNVLPSSIILGASLPAGGFTNLRMNYQTVNIGWWNNKNGYYLERQLCTVAEQCMAKVFMQEGDSKVMIYASVYGIWQWVTSGSSSSRRR